MVTVHDSYSGVSGAGRYAPGEVVIVSAGSRDNYIFSGWTSSDISFDSSRGETATFVMPAKDVSVTAQWERSGGSNTTSEPSAAPEISMTPEPSATPKVSMTPEPSATPEVSIIPEPTPSLIPSRSPRPLPTVPPTQMLTRMPDRKAQLLKFPSGAKKNLAIGSSRNLKVTGAKTKVIYRCSNTKRAKINSKGKLVALKVSTVKVTATALTSGTYKKATKKVVIKIVPKKVGIKSLKSKRKRCVSVRSNKAGKGNTGYQIQYKVGKGKIKTIKRKSNKTLSYTIRGLKSGKRFKVSLINCSIHIHQLL